MARRINVYSFIRAYGLSTGHSVNRLTSQLAILCKAARPVMVMSR